MPIEYCSLTFDSFLVSATRRTWTGRGPGGTRGGLGGRGTGGPGSAGPPPRP